MEVKSIPRLELIQVAEAVSREKSIDKEEVITAMEEAIEKAARSKYGLERDIRANIDRKNGSINIAQFTEVVEIVENESTQMTYNESQRRNLNIGIGEFYKQSLPPIDFGRIAAQTAKQVISQKVREAERQRQFQEYKDRVGEIVVGTIKRVDNQSVTIDLGRAEAIIKKDQRIDYPAKEISNKVQDNWNKNFKNDISIVVGQAWWAGNLSYHLKSRPKYVSGYLNFVKEKF